MRDYNGHSDSEVGEQHIGMPPWCLNHSGTCACAELDAYLPLWVLTNEEAEQHWTEFPSDVRGVNPRFGLELTQMLWEVCADLCLSRHPVRRHWFWLLVVR